MREYRYRTSTLAGPWRKSAAEALRDAIEADQAFLDSDPLHTVRWRVPGEIEMRNKPERD